MALLTAPIPRLTRKPYTPVKQPKAVRSMTVAVGIVGPTGVVLCADTQIRQSDTCKRYENKIFEINREYGCYVSYCGDTYLAKQMIETIRIAVRKKCTSPNECFEIVRSEYSAILRKEANKEIQARGWLELLVTVRREHLYVDQDYETSLYHLCGDTSVPVEHYAVIGIGDEMTHSLFVSQPLSLELEGNLCLAVDVVRRVKRSVQDCGGDSTAVLIPNRKELFEDPYFGDVRGEVVSQIEADYDFLEKESGFVKNYFGGSMSDERFDFILEVFIRNLKERRQSEGRIKNLS